MGHQSLVWAWHCWTPGLEYFPLLTLWVEWSTLCQWLQVADTPTVKVWPIKMRVPVYKPENSIAVRKLQWKFPTKNEILLCEIIRKHCLSKFPTNCQNNFKFCKKFEENIPIILFESLDSDDLLLNEIVIFYNNAKMQGRWNLFHFFRKL